MGPNTNLGDNTSWSEQEFRTAVNDRFNFSIHRQLPDRVYLDVTYFMNLGHNLPYSKQLNLLDPQLSYTHKALTDRRVPNPFYRYLAPEKFPGALRNQATVTRRVTRCTLASPSVWATLRTSSSGASSCAAAGAAMKEKSKNGTASASSLICDLT